MAEFSVESVAKANDFLPLLFGKRNNKALIIETKEKQSFLVGAHLRALRPSLSLIWPPLHTIVRLS